MFIEQPRGKDVTFELQYPSLQDFKMADAPHYGYGWYTQEQLEDYYNQLIGRFFTILNTIKIILLLINHIFQETMPRL